MASTGTRTALVGRDRELDELSALLGITEPGSAADAHVVLLAGDAGVGKTRLLTELRDRAFAEGWQVAAGHCLDFGDSALPYLPVTEVIGRLVEAHPGLVEKVAEVHPGLSRLQPGRRVMAAGVDERSAVDRAELFEAFHALLGEAAAVQPLLVVVEDAHWADSSTRDLVSFLCSRAPAGPVAVVVSYRGEDLHRRHPLRAKAAEWSRIRGVARVGLEPLDDGAVRQLVRGLRSGPMTEAEVTGIVTRAEGNAFFVEELVGAAGGRVPVDLADLLLLRLDQLDHGSRQVVRTMSVAGRRVSHDLLAVVSGVDAEELDQALRRAVERHVVVTAGDHGYAFRHALLAEAVYDDLLPGERVRIHAAYVEALRSGAAPGTAAELARHARAAHDLRTALLASVRAGDEAESVGGPDEAARHYEHALEIAEDPQHRGDLDVSALVLKAVGALVDSGNLVRGQQLVQRHLQSVADSAPETTLARLHLSMAFCALLTDNDIDWRAHLDVAITLIPQEPTAERARLLATAARVMMLGRVEGVKEVATESLALAETHNLSRTASEALTTLVGLGQRKAPIDQLAAELQESAEQAVRTGAVGAELRALFVLGRAYQDRAHYPEAAAVFTQVYERAKEVGVPWAPFAFDSRLQAAQVAFIVGDWEAVLELTDMRGQAPPRLQEAMLLGWRAAVLSARGTPQGDRLAGLHEQWSAEGVVATTAVPVEVEEAGREGRLDAAVAVADAATDVLARNWTPLFQARVRLTAVTLAAISANVAAMSAQERVDWAARGEEYVVGARRVVLHHQEEATWWGPESQAWTQRLEAELLRMRWLTGVQAPAPEEMVPAWEEAIAAFDELGHRYELAVSRLRLAEFLRSTGDVTASRELAGLARATAEGLGARPLLDELQRLGGVPVRAELGDEKLTPRELEILGLVAAGGSNGEIGRRLFISTKTVSVHVSNILRKLGAASRTEAAAIARRRGLDG